MRDFIEARLYVESAGVMITVHLPYEVALNLLKRLNAADGTLQLPFDLFVQVDDCLDLFRKLGEEGQKIRKVEEVCWYADSPREAADFLRDLAVKKGGNSFLIDDIEREGEAELRVEAYESMLGLPGGFIVWEKECHTSSSQMTTA